jgi:TolB protein
MLLPSDDQLRRALTRSGSPGLAGAVLGELAEALDQTPQVRRRPIPWPFADPLPGTGRSLGRRRVGTVALVVIAALSLLAGLAVVGLVGALRHPPPFGLARPGLIAYDSGGQIFVTNADGSDPRVVSSGPGSAIEPTFSLDGTHLAWFSVDASTSSVQLVVAGADGSGALRVASLAAADNHSGVQVAYLRIAWSPDGRRLAYAAPVSGLARLFVVGLHGAPPTEIGAPALEAHDPSWSPDGRRLAFRGGRFDDERGIYVADVRAGAKPVRITPIGRPAVTADASDSAPSWSPDGAWIAYTMVLNDADESHVFVVPAAGGTPRDLSGAGNNDFAPVWSPDGSWLAWRTGASGYPGRFVVARPDGSLRSALTPTVLGTPVWSPDGRRLLAASPNQATGLTDRVLSIDIETDTTVEIPAQPEGDPSWQRLGP